MKRKAALVVVAAAALTLAVSPTATATKPDGLKSELLVRSAGGQFHLADRDMRFFLGAGKPTDIALVRATLDPEGSTGWHTHPGTSMVLIGDGVMTVQEPRRGKCVTYTVPAGQAIEHPEGVHNFINNGTTPVVFYVTYFVKAGTTPLLIDVPTAPRACS
jgi:quercetin dioxygenase-like cupin family protein